ncbi:MAG: hypothetical protein ACR2GB_05390 [Nocardioidaceae bacterium]
MPAISSTLLLILGIGGIFASITIALTVVGVATQEPKAVGRSLAALEALSGVPPDMQKELDKPFASG